MNICILFVCFCVVGFFLLLIMLVLFLIVISFFSIFFRCCLYIFICFLYICFCRWNFFNSFVDDLFIFLLIVGLGLFLFCNLFCGVIVVIGGVGFVLLFRFRFLFVWGFFFLIFCFGEFFFNIVEFWVFIIFFFENSLFIDICMGFFKVLFRLMLDIIDMDCDSVLFLLIEVDMFFFIFC